ncbi:carboxylic acid reductase [Pseudomonas citrulli]|uniref:Thioester reductase domain-containing protein n=1 Tax=Pseudomonas lurida TaxID=244566 RepID=A0ABY9FP74_9PSED|nr:MULTISPECIES: carboxylic acid reductase [Pseudomonas]QDH66557.1 AMP-binding protein [Pseudomonas azotoformans]WLH05129.1 thioester reductase domain-containing protein [Pseudomonas lurida]
MQTTKSKYQAARLDLAEHIKALVTQDAQLQGAMPLSPISDAKVNPALGLAQTVALCMEGYSDRPALAQRGIDHVSDPVTGRVSRRLLQHFTTLSYGELWGRAKALASLWQHDDARQLRANDFLCIIAFAGSDFVTVDLAAIHNGAVVAPLQTNAPLGQLTEIVKEVQPRWLATSLECLPITVKLVLLGHRPTGVLLFDYDEHVDDHREALAAARAELSAAGLPDLLLTLEAACALGAKLPIPQLFSEKATDSRLSTLYYTSGSTGLPKGAMYPESMLKPNWRVVAPIPVIYMHYMPMNHSFGRSGVFSTLSNGGTCYFTAKSDLSELFNDIQSVRPTVMAVVPRICEMVYQQYQTQLERRSAGNSETEALRQQLIDEIRNGLLGGRLLSGSFGSAPLAPELREFMEACLGFGMDEFYGATEISGISRNNRLLRPPIIDYKLIDVPELGYFTTDKPHPRGELLVKTHAIMLGYYKRPEVTASAFDEDGYYKTGDIMAETATDVLVYLDRRNNVIKLSQGEFVAIARLEALFTNGHPLIRQAYLYGTSDRSFLLGVLVPNDESVRDMGITDEAALKAALREAVKQVAREEQLNAYEVPRDFLLEHTPFSVENGLLTGIGKYQRPKFKERYAARLEQLYDDIATHQADELQTLRREGCSAPIVETVARAIEATLGIEVLDPYTQASFTELGGDSLSALSCSVLLEDIYQIEVPASVINHPTGNLQQVVQYIERAQDKTIRRPTFSSVHGRSATEIRASDLNLDNFLNAGALEEAADATPPASEPRTVLVTGANGYLGHFLCLEWLERMAAVGGRVICIARGRDTDSARQRIAEAFESGDAQLKQYFETLANKHLDVLPGDLGEPELGLSATDWNALTETVDLIVHPAAFVNHVLPYSQLFGPNVAGTAELIRLALSARLKPIHYVSTVAAAAIVGGVIDEEADVREASPVRPLDAERYADGYANSKWAGEVLLRDAHERFGLPVAVFRSDMILAHSYYQGQVNASDMFTRWLSSVVRTGLAPRSFYAQGAGEPHYDGLPVDFTAKAIAVLGAEARDGYQTYHVINPHEDGISMDTFVDWAISAGHPIQRIDQYDDWFARFETALRGLPEKQRQQSFLPLLHQLRQPMPRTAGAWVSATRFQRDVRKFGVGPDRDIPHLSAAFIGKCLADIKHLGLM